MDRLRDKVALVTGGVGGIGWATAQRMSEEGAHVTIADLDDVRGPAFAAQIRGRYVHLDVTDEGQWREAVAQVTAEQGRLDVLVNAAGIEGDYLHGSPLDTSLAEWRKVMAVNLDGTFLGCRSVLPMMMRAKKGSIINVGSLASFQATPSATAYGASKAGVQQLAKTVAIFGTRNGMRIRCNSVHPGMIRTPMLGEIFSQVGQLMRLSTEQAQDALLKSVPMNEPGHPDDVAWLIVYLASDEARYVTGSEFTVDGGWRYGEAR